MGLLDGKVAIITGAGNGIGRCYALRFAREGAKVVVNDLGGTRDGTGEGSRAADEVVEAIKAAGGEAVANYASVAEREGAESIIASAVDTYGRADILINNAGILRDKTLIKLEENNWDIVVAVHLKGSFLCGQAFARHIKERADKGETGGRIVNTSSYAGLIGNYGQTNYAAAKAGIAGLTRVWAQELAKLGVTVNAIAPMAKTRMTDDIAMVPEDMTPEQIVPMVLYLCSDKAEDVNGRIFGIHGQQLFEYKQVMTEGVTKSGSELWTADEIDRDLKKIGALAQAGGAAGAAAAPAGPEAVIAQAFKLLPEVFVPEKAKGWNANIQFKIDGADDYSIIVADGACRSAKGLEGAATCTVKVAAQVWADIVTGKLKAEKAFMSGQISADNLGDMMKLGGAFDMKKAAELAAKMTAAAPAGGGAAAAPAGPEAIIAQAFKLLPEVFVPEKAKGWNANIQFKIDGADDYSIIVADGACRSAKGLEGKPTCTVKVEAQTWADIVTGKEKAEKAFMSGKISADNLGDMMKLGGAFDMKKAAELAAKMSAPAAGAPAAAPAGPDAIIGQAFSMMPKIFVPEKAKGWTANIQFEIDGASNRTVMIQDGACSVAEGLEGAATCTVKVKAQDWIDIIQGRLKPETAFMQQKIAASNLGDMMKFGGAFDMKKAAELAEQAASAAPAAESAPVEKGLNRDYVGRTFSGGCELIKREHTELYADATNDDNPAYKGEAAVAPPLFPVRLFKEALFGVMTDPGLRCDLLLLVHGEQDMEFLKPLRPNDLVSIRAKISGIEDKSSGQLLHVHCSLFQEGELVCRARSSMFVRDPEAKKKSKGSGKKEAPPEPSVDWSFPVQVTEDQSLRYADASLDNNPIHIDPGVAKMAGLPGIILQGLCTMAFTSQAVIKQAAGGDPTRLKRLSVRFSKPVLMNQTITTEGWSEGEEEGQAVVGFRAKNDDGDVVIANGRALIA